MMKSAPLELIANTSMITVRLTAATMVVAVLFLGPWSALASAPTAAADQPAEKQGLAPAATDHNPGRLLSSSPRKPGRVVQFELVEDYEQGLLPQGRRIGLIVRMMADSGKSQANVVAILESSNSGRTLISLNSGKDPSVLEATTSVELPAFSGPDSLDGGRGAGVPGSVQMHRINVTFARLQGMRLEPLFKRRVYLALGQNGSAAAGTRHNGAAAGDVRINTDSASTAHAADDHPPSVPGIVDQIVKESDVAGAKPVSSESQDYWRELGRRLQHRWAERHAAVITPEKIARAPRVRFRLYPSGIVQMIYVESSSGSARMDIAGLESVLDTQPYSPLPAQLREPYVNVHVHFRGEPRD